MQVLRYQVVPVHTRHCKLSQSLRELDDSHIYFVRVSDCVRLLSCHQTRNVLEVTTLPCYERGYKLSAQRQKKVGSKIKGEKKNHEGSLLDEVVTVVGGSHFVEETTLLLPLGGGTDDLGRHGTH